MRKSLRVQVRVSEELRARLDSAEKIAKIKESVFFVELLEAYCDYVESNDETRFPLSVISKKELEELKAKAYPATTSKGRSKTGRMLKRIGSKASAS
jgi:hypothetical protein